MFETKQSRLDYQVEIQINMSKTVAVFFGPHTQNYNMNLNIHNQFLGRAATENISEVRLATTSNSKNTSKPPYENRVLAER